MNTFASSPVSPALLAALQNPEAIRAELARRSLSRFIQEAWPNIDPSPYIHGRHIDVICEHLEAVTRGECRRLLINVPPRCMKSLAVAVAWPVWTWLQDDASPLSGPGIRWLFSSYAQTLSVRDSVKCRRLIESPWFRRNYAGRFALTDDQNTKIRFENDRGGYRLATSVDGALTGEGGDVVVVDDPHNSTEAQSAAVRESTLEWFDTAMSTRLNDPKTGAYVIIMQRLHEKDLAGHLIDKGGWEHLCLPAEHEPKHVYLSRHDWRTEPGELLWPERLGRDEIAELKTALGSYAASGQLQQLPSPSEGGLLKRQWWRPWAKAKLPAFDVVIHSWDTAFTDKTTNDYSAVTSWGLFRTEDDEVEPKDGTPLPRYAMMLLGAWQERLAYPDVRRKIKALREEDGADLVLIENKGSGISLLMELRRSRVPVTPFDPGRLDKSARAQMAAASLEGGLVHVDPTGPGVMTVIDQCAAFPNAAHDDLVDTVTQAVLHVRRGGKLHMPDEPRKKRRPDRTHRLNYAGA